MIVTYLLFIFFFNDTATTEIYTLSLHDALPISLNADVAIALRHSGPGPTNRTSMRSRSGGRTHAITRSEEHTSELQSPCNLVCRLLLEKKKKKNLYHQLITTYYNHKI